MAVLLLFLSTLAFPALAEEKPAVAIAWKQLQPGVEYALASVKSSAYIEPKEVHFLRMDPAVAKLRPQLASEGDRRNRTARQWSEEFKFSVVINLGMFNVDDHVTHTGYLRHGSHVNSSKWIEKYQSVLLVGPLSAGLPNAALLDLDLPETKAQLKSYDTVVQNLRLIKGVGQNAWADNKRKWSEAALAIDDKGRLLFIFCRTPFSMKDFNRLLLSLGLGIQRAMHLEGGPEASLSVHSGAVNLDLCGSFESGFWENDTNTMQWPLPNVLGIEEAAGLPEPKPEP